MRIIGGSAKGVRLGAVPPGTRPVSDRAREGLFSSLGDRVVGAVVLDLFAGTGALGIEALSRGALEAVFVDHARPSSKAIRENLARTPFAARGRVVTSDVLTYLRKPPPSRVDIAFADPPYDVESERIQPLLRELATAHVAEGFTVALTRGKGSSAPSVPLHWAVARQLHYGDSLVFLYREVGWA
ncbi:MAG: rRNA (guanine966-N2)-methyltransferase [Actinomycetota bacterium]|jgi:16S rRNA (guanine966-N2)-methyltransferase|nr:rRNA (guanine966-N2)-methyltransferase [Actinomycetota bacterium]